MRSYSSPRAVSMMNGTGPRPRIRRHTSRPSMPGSIRSRTTRSGQCAAARASASGPSPARSTTYPARSRYPVTTSATVGSSSTTSTRAPACPYCCWSMQPASHRARADAAAGSRRPCFVRSLYPICPFRARRVRAVTTPSDEDEQDPLAASVDVVLPCLDEAEALRRVLERIPPGWRAIVVDNGSTDGSAALAHALGAHVVHEARRGFGAACHAGLSAATADIVCFCDCDASLDPADLVPFVRRVLAGEADLVLGRRRPQARGAWPPHARAGNLALARLLRRRPGLRLRDRGPLRAARREPLLALGLTDRRSGYPLQMVVRAADAGWGMPEHDVPYLPRTGASKVTGTWRGTWQAVRDMRCVLREPPARGGGTVR